MQALINVDVDDLDKATHFYETAFGLKVGRRFGADGVELLGSSAPIYLLFKAAGTAASSTAPLPRSYGRHWTPVHLDFVVEEIHSAVRQAVDAGARLESAIATHTWGRLALMVDPFGHGFCFVQFLGRGYDEIALSD
jgi:predicted enzyme related to lactoylglutathione lyase